MCPSVGFNPISSLKAAGTRPDPAVSVPREKATNPFATATADPLLEPPGRYASSKGFFGAGYGVRIPTSPVAN